MTGSAKVYKLVPCVDHTEARNVVALARTIASSAAVGIARGGRAKGAPWIGPTGGCRSGSAVPSA
jgi:hypothetical protein